MAPTRKVIDMQAAAAAAMGGATAHTFMNAAFYPSGSVAELLSDR